MAFKINTDLLSPLLCLLYDTFEEPLSGKLFVKRKEHFLHALSSYEKGSLGWRTR